MRHALKTDPEVFEAVSVGAKTYEIRFNDRGFAVGDELQLLETTRTGADIAAGAPLEYTGREILKTVSHVLGGYGLADGWVILSFENAAPATCASPELPRQIVQDANRYQDIRQLAVKHTTVGSEGETARWVIEIPVLVSMHAGRSLDADVDQLRSQRGSAPAFPEVADPQALPAASEDLFDLIRNWAATPEGQRGNHARTIIDSVNKSHLAAWLQASALFSHPANNLQGPADPTAWQVLPKELTETMLDAAVKASNLKVLDRATLMWDLKTMYAAAVKAAPQPVPPGESTYERFLRSDLGKHCAAVSEMVKDWPAWKRDLWGPERTSPAKDSQA